MKYSVLEVIARRSRKSFAPLTLTRNSEANFYLVLIQTVFRVDILKLLLAQSAVRQNVRNNLGETPLFLSLETESSDEIVSVLINSGCDINIPNYEDVTPLHLAVRRKSSNIAHKLIRNGANINSKDQDGYTPLHEAATKDQFDNVCMLLYYNALPNEKTFLRATPFHMACNNQCGTASAKYLMNYVVDIDQVDASGYTPLHIALNTRSDLAKDLIQHGADVNAVVHGTTGIYFSLFYETSDIFELIWHHIDCNRLLAVNYPLLHIFMAKCKFPTDQILKCLYLMFESSFIDDFLHQHLTNYEESLFSYVVHKSLSINERIKIYYLFLSRGVTVYFNDICLMYDKYGFDASLELILTSGACIVPNRRNRFNLLVSRICHNNLNIYIRGRDYFTTSIFQSDRKHYYRFYSLPNLATVHETVEANDLMTVKKVCTLLELSRDVVRAVIYKNCKKPFAFNVYSEFLKLQLPAKVTDILFLKQPLYSNRGITFYVS